MRTGEHHNLYLTVQVDRFSSEKDLLKQVNSILKEYSHIIDIRRVDTKENHFCVIYYVDFESNETLVTVLDKIRKAIPQAMVTFIDQDREVRG